MKYSRVVILSILILLLGFGQSVMPVNAETNPTVLMFDVSGNTKTPAEKILGVISKTRIGEPLNTQSLQSDLQAIMDIGYFADVQVKSEKFLNGVKLIFTVIENPVFKAVRITGPTRVKAADLEAMFSQKPGEIFNATTFRNDLDKVKKYCREQKGLFMESRQQNITSDGVINVELTELKLGKIKIVGLEKTKEFVVRRELTIKEGEVFDANAVREDIYRIHRLRLFDSVDPKMESGAAPHTIDLILELKEAATGSFQIGASYSETTNQMGGLLVFSEDNLMGLGQSISIDTNISKDGNNVSFNYLDPWLDKKGTSFRLSVWNSDSELTSTLDSWGFSNPILIKRTVMGEDGKPKTDADGKPIEVTDPYYSNTPYLMDLNRTGLLLSFGRRFWKDTTGNLKFNFEKNTIKDFYLTSDSGKTTGYKKDHLDESKHPSDFWDNSVGFGLTKNKLQNDGRSFVKGGYWLSANYAVAGQYLGGEFDYQTASLEGKWFRSLSSNLVLGTRLQWSDIAGDYPDYDALYMGGMFKLRGYKDRRFHDDNTRNMIGSDYLLSNTELRYRIPANKALEVVLFYDAGKLLDSGSADLKYDYGVGLRYDIPFLGLLRLDQYWNGDGKKDIVISLGELF